MTMHDKTNASVRGGEGLEDARDARPAGMPVTRRAFCALAAAGTLALAGCVRGGGQGATDDGTVDDGEAAPSASREVVKADDGSIHLRDRDSIYAQDDYTSVVCMYLTVRRGNSGENTDHGWEDINANSKYWYEKEGLKQYSCEAILQVGDETGPLPEELGYTAIVPNATVKTRGQSSSYNAQKNYKVSLKKDKGTWRDQRVINLNKHQTEGMRFRNKLAFDLLKHIPQTMSCRTQFVHLYVCDQTQTTANAAFEDYGLYTQVEQLNKTYLKNHDLDRYGQLYKIEFFEFYRYPDAIKLTSDPTYDETAFSEILESKGSTDHSKLIAMLDAVNDYATPIEDTLDAWFDVENLTYWMAFHMLVGNYDVQSRNAFLYSPQNVDRFYLLSWDNDACFTKTEWELCGKQDGLGWERGVSNYWGQVLFKRALKLPEFRAALDAAVTDLVENYLTWDCIADAVARYRGVVEPYLYARPDMLYAPLARDDYGEVAKAIPSEVQENLDSYHDSLKCPMPFFIGTPTLDGDRLTLIWDASYDFDAEAITYSATLARDVDFTQVYEYGRDLTVPCLETTNPGEGQYFLKVEAQNESGYTQTSFDTYVRADDNNKVYGVICFYILADGSLVRADDDADASVADNDADAEDAEGGKR